MSQDSHKISVTAQLNALASGERGVVPNADTFRDAFKHGALDKKDFASALGCQPYAVYAALNNRPTRKIATALSQLGFGDK